jgi:hypothetical protein
MTWTRLRDESAMVCGYICSVDELSALTTTQSSVQLWCKARKCRLMLERWQGQPKRSAHGISGKAYLRREDGSRVSTEPSRVHMCREHVCGSKFDPRRGEYECHGAPLQMLLARAATGVAEPAGAVAVAKSPEQVADEAGVADPPVLIDLGESLVSVDCPADVASDVICQAMDPLNDLAEDTGMDHGMSASKMLALQQCLDSDAAEWAQSYKDLPPLLFLAWGLHHRRKVHVHCGGESQCMGDVYAPPGAEHGPRICGTAEDAVHVLATKIGREADTDARYLQWPTSFTDVSHWHICEEVVDSSVGGPHLCCGGAQCGGQG